MTTSQKDIFHLSHTANASLTTVWRAFTDAKELAKWFGPEGFLTTAHRLELRPNGIFLYSLKSEDGNEMWGKWTFLAINPQSSLTVIVSFSDANAGITSHPMAPDWPKKTLSTTRFTAVGDQTQIDLEWSPFDATAKEQETFLAGFDGMVQGWSGTFKQLDQYLAKT